MIKLYMLNDTQRCSIWPQKEANMDLCVVPEIVLNLVSMGQLMVDQLIVGTTGRTALGTSLVEPEPHDSSVVFLTCRARHYG